MRIYIKDIIYKTNKIVGRCFLEFTKKHIKMFRFCESVIVLLKTYDRKLINDIKRIIF